MYRLTIEQTIYIDENEYKRIYDLLERDKSNIVLIEDNDGNKHLYHWVYVTNSHVDFMPDNLPES